jgi:segregation and condensation protein B
MEPDFIRRIVEAALLASPQPLTVAQLAALFTDEDGLAPVAIEQALDALREQSAERGVELVEVASGFRFQVRADVHAHVARLWTERQAKYTRATLETLALIAYRQPITRGEIEQIRGVGVSASTIKLLEEREWIRVIGHRDVPGRPELFGTTKAFLDYFGLKSLDRLPALSELKDIPELEPQFPFDAPPGVAAAAMPADDGDSSFAADAIDPDAIAAEAFDAEALDADVPDGASDTRSHPLASADPGAADSTPDQDAGEAVAPEQHHE